MSQSVKESWGYCCPSCGSDESIDITAEMSVRLLPDHESNNTDSRNQSWDWDDSKYASCVCGYCDSLSTFNTY